MKIFGSITELVKVVLRKSGYAVTVEPSTATADTTFQLPAAGGGTKAIVTADSSNTLTNKTFDADGTGNSISNIENADIKAGAAIDATKIADGSVTNTEFQYIGGVTSDVQTQLNSKQATVTGAATTITSSNLTASVALQSDASGKVAASSVTSTELGYVSGVTSAIQTQLNSKQDSDADLTAIAALSTDGIIAKTGAGAAATRTITAGSSKVSVTNGSGVAGNPTVDVSEANLTLNNIGGTLGISKGGTGQTTQQAAINALVGTQTANRVLRSDGTNMSLSQVALSTDVSGQLPLSSGGTGANYASSNALLNGILPSQSGNANKFLKSDGTDTSWASAGGGVGKNYLQDFYDADSAITVQQSVGDTLGSSTRLNPTRFGSSSAVADLISQSTPDSSLRGTSNYLIQFTANAQFIETPLFTLDGSDLGKAISVQMDVTGVSMDNDVQVYAVRYNSSNVLQERIPIAGNASSTTPFSAKLPTGTKTFNGFFIPSSTATDKYAIRVLRNANNTSMRIDALVVGPQQVLQGAIVTDWVDGGTITITATTTNPTKGTIVQDKWWYRQVGDSYEFRMEYSQSTAGTGGSGQYLFTLPAGLAIDTTKIQSLSTIDPGVLGSATTRGGANYYTGVVTTAATAGTSSQIRIHLQTTVASVVGSGNNGLDSNPVRYYAEFRAPIAGKVANTQMAARAVEEYAANDGTSNIYGPAGTSIAVAIAAGGATRTVTFQSPILPTDKLELEVDLDGVGRWVSLPAGSQAVQASSGALIGAYNTSTDVGVIVVPSATNNTQCEVRFRQYRNATTSWTTLTNGRWRVRKVSSGAAVGFPVGARNVIGDTTGTAVPAGYIGEKIVTTSASITAAATNTISTVTGLSLPLTTGVWLITLNGSFFAGSSPTANGSGYMGFSTDSGANSFTDRSDQQNTALFEPSAAAQAISGSVTNHVVVSSNTTYYAKYRISYSGTAPTVNVKLIAIRIA